MMGWYPGGWAGAGFWGMGVMVLLWGLIVLLSKLGGWLGRLARPHFVNKFFGKA